MWLQQLENWICILPQFHLFKFKYPHVISGYHIGECHSRILRALPILVLEFHLHFYFFLKILYNNTFFSTLAWKMPWMEEPGRLQSMGLLRVGHD